MKPFSQSEAETTLKILAATPADQDERQLQQEMKRVRKPGTESNAP